MADDVLTRNENDELAVRVVSTSGDTSTNPNDVYTRDENGKLCVRVTGAGGDQHNLGYFATQAALEEAHPTAEAGDWAIVGATDTVWIWDTDTSAWVDSDQKGQVTSVNNQTGAVTITADDILPTQTGNSGKFLTTDGTNSSWETVDALPTQTGQSGKFLTTDGSSASWASVDALPTQTGHSGKFLTTDGTDASWGTPVVATFRVWGANE